MRPGLSGPAAFSIGSSLLVERGTWRLRQGLGLGTIASVFGRSATLNILAASTELLVASQLAAASTELLVASQLTAVDEWGRLRPCLEGPRVIEGGLVDWGGFVSASPRSRDGLPPKVERTLKRGPSEQDAASRVDCRY